MEPAGLRRRAPQTNRAQPDTDKTKNTAAPINEDEYYRKLERRGRNMALIIIVYMLLCVTVFLWFQVGHVPPPLLVILVPGFRADYLQRLPALDTPFFERTAQFGSRVAWLRPAFPAISNLARQLPLITGADPWYLAKQHRSPSSQPVQAVQGEAWQAHQNEIWNQYLPVWNSAIKQWRSAAVFGIEGACEELDGYTVDVCHQVDSKLEKSVQLKHFLEDAVGVLIDKSVNLAVVHTDLIASSAMQHGSLSSKTMNSVRQLDQILSQMDTFLPDGKSVYDSVNVMIVSDGGLADVSHRRPLDLIQIMSSEDGDRDLVFASGGAALVYAEQAYIDRATNVFNGVEGVKALQPHQIPYHLLTEDQPVPDLLVTASNGTVFQPSGEQYSRVGYNFDLSSEAGEIAMRGILMARGPSFKRARALGPIDARDVYPLLAALLDITPEIHAGSLYHTADMVMW